ncbi:MAG TPA: 30S ribosomal protein S6 [Alphaproteobacteria bacterium]|nr:30S ribosomal protein S6 [Alphaproteobacteria bacterium]
MAFYESTFIARPDLSSKQAEELAQRYAGLIAEQGGSVAKSESWGLRSLAYRIKKHRKGHYAHFALDAPPAAIKEMERTMKIDEDVLRFLTVRVDALDLEPSSIMSARGRDDERHGRGRDRDAREGGPREGGPREGGAREGAEDEGAPAQDERGEES